MRSTSLFAAAAFAAGLLASGIAAAADRITIELTSGPVVIELSDKAPKHAARIKALAAAGAYDNVLFHRVIDGFMAQTGDVRFAKVGGPNFDQAMAGMGGSDEPDLEAEFSSEPFVRGTVGMARSNDPNSANSQFFIMFAPAPYLDNNYTVVGKVVEGIENVDKIKRGDANNGGVVANPDRMITVTVGG